MKIAGLISGAGEAKTIEMIVKVDVVNRRIHTITKGMKNE